MKFKLNQVVSIFLISFVLQSGAKLENACRFSQFRCDSGLCLDTEKLCNGQEDCPQGEDEKGTTQYDCTRSTLSDDCKANEFRCRFGGCISNSLRCDGKPDCWGGTDEANDFCGYERPKSNQNRPKQTTVTPQSSSPTPPTKNPYDYISERTSTQNYYYTSSSTEGTTTARSRRTTVSTAVPKSTTTTEGSTERSTRRTTVSTLKTTTSTSTEATKNSPKSQNGKSHNCPVIELDAGQKVSCFQQKLAQEIQCAENPSPEGTRAEISCSQYWIPPETGPDRTIKHCKDGRWQGGGFFNCELDCGAGGYPPMGYVTGGSPSVQGKWPWHAGLYESDPPGSESYRHICGATLVTRQALITAAHCVAFASTNTKKNAGDLRVYLGKYYRNFNANNEHVQPIHVQHIELHSNYNFAQLESDIAILWLERPVEITSFVHPVCMPHEDFDGPLVGDPGSLAGWGSLGDRNYPKTLNEATLPVRSNHECIQNSPVLANLVRDSTFCAGHNNGTSACDGDSGGGLVFPDSQNSNKWTILGIVSGGVPKAVSRGCDPKYYAAFTKVSAFRKFIDKVLDKF